MYRKLTLLCFILSAVIAWGQDVSYPKKGLILHYDFNGNVRDKVQGVVLKSVPTGYGQSKQMTADDVRFVESPDGEKGAMVMLTSDIPVDLSPVKYPDLTVVMRIMIAKKQDANNPALFLCKPKDEKGFTETRKLKLDKNMHMIEEVLKDTSRLELISVGGVEDIKSEKIPVGSWETILVSFSAKDSSVIFACGGEKFKFEPWRNYGMKEYSSMRLFPRMANHRFGKFFIGDSSDQLYGAIDDLRIYNRLLSDEEIEAIFDGEVVTVEKDSGSFFSSPAFTYGVMVLYIFIIIYALVVLIMHPRKLKEVTAASIAKEKQNNKSLSEDERDELAMKLYKRTLEKCGYEAAEESEEAMTLHYPKSGLEAKNIRESLMKSLSYGSSNPEVIDKQNLLVKAYNRMMGRAFNGSPFYIVLVYICLYFMIGKFGDSQDAWSADSSFWVNVLMVPIRMWPITLGLLVYVLFSFGPYFMKFKGDKMHVRKQSPELGDRPERTQSGAVIAAAGAFTLASVGMGILHFFGEAFRAIPNSMSYVLKNVKTGATVGGGSVFTGGGIIFIGIAVILLWILIMIATVVIVLSPFFVAFYKFIRNYVLYY